jgi:hypothetical protein
MQAENCSQTNSDGMMKNLGMGCLRDEMSFKLVNKRASERAKK